MGLLQSDKLPGHLRFLQHSVNPKDGSVVSLLGGSGNLHRTKNYLSMHRLYMDIAGVVIFLVQHYMDPQLFSADELRAEAWGQLAVFCNLFMLRQRIYGGRLGNITLGVLGMTASFATLARMYFAKWRSRHKPPSLGKMCSGKIRVECKRDDRQDALQENMPAVCK